MVALFIVPLRPEHQPHLGPLAWAFVAYKALLFLTLRAWPRGLRILLFGSIAVDLIFVSLFVWFSGGDTSHFYLLFYLLVALVAVHFPPWLGLLTAAGAGAGYAVVTILGHLGGDWHSVASRATTLFLLSGSLGYLSERERVARARAERLNLALRRQQERLEEAYGELKAAQERLVHLERLATIGQMAAKISHEVRNPLASISLNTELLEDELLALPDDRRKDATSLVAAIRAQVDVLGAATEEYLRFARLPAPRPQEVEMGAMLHQLAEFVRRDAESRGIRVEVEVDGGRLLLPVDLGQIRQALLNLIRNGMEAMPAGGILRLAARRVDAPRPAHPEVPAEASFPDPPLPRSPDPGGGWIEVAVQDTGTGIPEDIGEKLFEPFFTTKEGGTGLGLAITRQIVTDHGGQLTWEPAPGGGTIFRLKLPAPPVTRA
ncbi:MAG: ATP-binding protein [Candidatus Methylomirabilales bacterium]